MNYIFISKRNRSIPVLTGVAACAALLNAPVAFATNQINLQVTPRTAQVKEKITIKASVITDDQPATGGTVTFLDGHIPLGSIQVVGNNPALGHRTGTAVLTTILAPGDHSLFAVYGGTAQSPDIVRSTRVIVTVTGKTPSLTKLTATPNSQHPQNYDFTATVTGSGLLPPSHGVKIRDITAGVNLGVAPLDRVTTVHVFGRPEVVPASGGPAQAAIADLNGDGFADVATANADFSVSSMGVLLGNGDGTFQSPVTYTTGVFTSGIVIADFNQDGIPDIAAMSQGSGNDGDVSIFLGNGDGTFQNPIVNNLGIFPVAIVAGDFDRDGALDIASIDYFAAKAYISLGNGDGTFQTPVPYRIGSGPYSIATADFNNDTFADLAVVNDNTSTVSVLLGNGDGTFRTQRVFPTGFQVEFVTTGDLDGDGNQDIVVANYADRTAGVLLGNGNGTFQPQVAYPVGGYTSGLAIADLDGDGALDIAVSCNVPPRVDVLYNQRNGTFGAAQEFNIGPGVHTSFQLSIGDLNGDGAPDIISEDITSSISVLKNGTTVAGTLSDIAVPGSPTDTETIGGFYLGDSRYDPSRSNLLELAGSGLRP
ncbi:MAG TPA: FG-GAP-like repeat-containing protein [Candidatus Udaeobacter sp.]|nr:FG-GAP-like repeat-containing protein [Candidatus Udaeobacter sp.]